MNLKKIIIFSLKFGATFAIIFFLIKNGRLNFDRLLLFWDSPNILLFFLFILLALIIPLTALRWWMLLKALNIRASLIQAYFLTWIGNFFNATLPGAVTGDLVKGYYILKTAKTNAKTTTITTLFIDRATGLFGLIAMAFAALILNWDLIMSQQKLRPLAIFIISCFILIIIFYVIILWPFKQDNDAFERLIKALPKSSLALKVYSAFKSYRGHGKTLAATLFISVAIHILAALLLFLITQMTGTQDISLAAQMFIMPIGFIATAIPISPGGVGVGHAAFETLYSLLGIKGGADIFNLFIIVQLVVYLLGGVVYFFYDSGDKKHGDGPPLDNP